MMDLGLVQALIPILVPLLVAGAKWGIPKLPKGVLPALAILLGAGADLAAYAAGLQGTSHPLAGALLGAAGVGLREVLDRIKQAISA